MKLVEFHDEEQLEIIGDQAKAMHIDHEVQMARSELYKAAKAAMALHDMLKHLPEDANIEGWVQAKITKASDYLCSVRSYLEYEQHSTGDITVDETLGLSESSQGMAEDQKNEPEPKTKSGTGAKPTTSTHCPGCYSTDIKTYSDGEKECHQCGKTWHVKGVAEGSKTTWKDLDKPFDRDVKKMKNQGSTNPLYKKKVSEQGVAESERQPGRFSGTWQILVNRKKVLRFRGNFDQETADRVGVVNAFDRGLYNPSSGDKIKIVPVMLDRKQSVAEGEYDDTELYDGCFVRDEMDGDGGEVFRMNGDPYDRRVRIEDKDGRGWYISPSRLKLVPSHDKAVHRYFPGKAKGWDDDEELSEMSAGATGSASVATSMAGNGFKNGGPGTIKRESVKRPMKGKK